MICFSSLKKVFLFMRREHVRSHLFIYIILLLACCWKCLKVSVFCLFVCLLFLFSVLCPVFLLSFLPSHLRPACGVNYKDKTRLYSPPPPSALNLLPVSRPTANTRPGGGVFHPPPPQPYIKTCFQGHDRHQTREWWWCSTPHPPTTLNLLPVARSTAKTRLGGGVLHLPPSSSPHPPPPPPLRIKTCFQCQD